MIHQEEAASAVVAVAVEVEEPVAAAGSSSVAPAGTDQLDLEAAEQLIQLSGGADDGGSESRSADSVKCSRGNKRDKEAAVESRRRSADAGRPVASAAGKDDGDGGEPDGAKGAEMSLACSMASGGVEEKDKKKKAAAVVGESPRRSAADRPTHAVGKDRDGGIVHGEERKRPKFRSLAAIYRETETKTTGRVTPPAAGGEGGSGDRDPSEGERRKKKVKRAAEVIPQYWSSMHMHVN